MRKVFKAVNHIHSIGVCHRDLKPDNFMFKDKTDDSELKLIDFGLSNRFRLDQIQNMHSIVGSPYYTAPEVFSGKYSNSCDLWSCGVLLYTLLSGTFPFFGDTTF